MDILNKLQTGLKLNYNNMDNSTNKKNSFWIRKVSIWHIIYLIVIALIINIFLLCIVPGRVSDDAYHNFSFAATITSIVLAVVSIVYSLQSGLSSIGQLNSIKEIESRIGNELCKFSDIEDTIAKVVENSISPLEASMGNIQQSQDDIQKSQVEINNWLRKEYREGNDNESADVTSLSKKNTPRIFSVIFYTCVRSKETKKEIPVHILEQHIGSLYYYCEGVIRSLSIYNPQKISIRVGDKSSKIVVERFDENLFGKKEYLKQQILKGGFELGNSIIIALDEYYDANVDTECEVL